MIGAILYVIGCSARNRALRRLARLREPRYMIGAAAGLAYAAFTLYMRQQAFSDQPAAEAARATLLPLGTAAREIGSLLLAAAAAVSWFMPFESGLLRYSAAETALLLPAPITRRQLLVYRLLRSQLAVLAGALIFALAYPTGGLGARTRGLAGAWILLMITHVFFTGVTLGRAGLRERSKGVRYLLAWPGLVVSFAPVLAVLIALAGELTHGPIGTASHAFGVLRGVSAAGLPYVLLSPFRMTIAPLFAASSGEFARAMSGASLMYATAIAWVMWGYESADLVQGSSLERAAGAAKPRSSYTVRQADFPLDPKGRAEAVFVWKGALQTFRVVDRRVIIRLVLLVLWASLAAAVVSRTRGLAQLLGMFAAWATAFSVLMAPHVLRLDLRQDLEYLDLLKTWPLPGRVVVRGEILWPTIVVSALAWMFGGIAWLLAEAAFGFEQRQLVHALSAAVMILIPAVIAVQYTVHNGIAILFPAWVPIGPMRPRGVDAMGQRLILLGATWVLLAVALLPTALTALVLWRLFDGWLGAWVLPPAAVVGGTIVWLEVMGATRVLGRAFDQLDVTSTERAE